MYRLWTVNMKEGRCISSWSSYWEFFQITTSYQRKVVCIFCNAHVYFRYGSKFGLAVTRGSNKIEFSLFSRLLYIYILQTNSRIPEAQLRCRRDDYFSHDGDGDVCACARVCARACVCARVRSRGCMFACSTSPRTCMRVCVCTFRLAQKPCAWTVLSSTRQ